MAQIKTISVIVPYFNAHKTVATCLASALNCAPFVDEIVVVDDGSAVDSRKHLDRVLAVLGSDKIKVLTHSRNLGGGFARNTAVAAARNHWIFCLDSDNIMARHFLEESIRVAKIFPDEHVFAPQRMLFFRDSDKVVSHAWNVGEKAVSIDEMFATPVLPPSSGNYLYTKESWEVSGGYPTGAGSLDAWGFGFRQVASGYDIQVVPGTYYFHRITPNSYWTRESHDEKVRSTRATGIVFEKADRLPPSILRRLGRHDRYRTWYTRLGGRVILLSADARGERGQEGIEQMPLSWVTSRNDELAGLLANEESQ